jgi:hypothetical protein
MPASAYHVKWVLTAAVLAVQSHALHINKLLQHHSSHLLPFGFLITMTAG